MLAQELRAAAFSRGLKQLRHQGHPPCNIIGSNGSCLLSRNFTTSATRLIYVPLRKSNPSFGDSTITHLRPDPIVHPESLQRTLEAHRDSNLSALIRKQLTDNLNDQNAGIFRPKLPRESSDQSGHEWPDEKQKRSKKNVAGGSGSKSTAGRGARSVYTDYKGVSQPPTKDWAIARVDPSDPEMRPWLAHLDRIPKGSEDAHDYLTEEILAFADYIKPTEWEKAAVDMAVADVRKIVEAIDPAIKTSVIGSRSTGLAMPTSDIDINIRPPGHVPSGERQAENRPQSLHLLRAVIRKLRKKGGPKPTYREPFLIQAIVPIVRAQHTATGLELQIQSTLDGNSGMELVKAYADEYPTLQPLFLVLRQVIKMRGMGQPRSRGLGSYTLIMMIVAALKFSNSRFDREDAGRQLLYILDFYSKLDFMTTGIIVDPPQLFAKPQHSGNARPRSHAKVRHELMLDETGIKHTPGAPPEPAVGNIENADYPPLHPYAMYLQDPGDPFNDLGRQAGVIRHVQATFETLVRKTKTAMHLFKERSSGHAPFSLLEPCLAGNYRRLERERKALQRIGKTLAQKPSVAGYL